MSFSLGIVGLPNVGKSTLFNALTNLGVEVASYPFTTIEPNVGIVAVPDLRLVALAKVLDASKTIPTVIEFKDIAGLVKNAHQGAGLGNQFLSHIREVDAIVHIVRFFEDKNIVHVEGNIDPGRDLETVETELALADLQLVEKKLETLKKAAKSDRVEDRTLLSIAQKNFEALSAGKPASSVNLTAEEIKYLHEFPLLTLKPMLYVANIESEHPPQIIAGKTFIPLDLKLEAELSELSDEERKEYLQGLGLSSSGLDKLIKESYRLLNLITFFTAAKPQEIQAWACKKGTKAPLAAGLIHTDFEKGFIKAEVVNWQKLLEAGSWSEAHSQGLIRTEGKDYIMQDGDVVFFKHAP